MLRTLLRTLLLNYHYLAKDDIGHGPTKPLFDFDVLSVQRQTKDDMALRELQYETKMLNFPSSLMIS